ncbi:MAG: ABC transporter substrate-binding protein [Isosphaeraceae bacterium]
MPWVTALFAAMPLALALMPASRGLGQVPGAAPAEGRDLLQSNPFDRITLADNVVILTEPVSPRPLPEYDPKKAAARKTRKNDPPPAEGNISLPGEKSKFKPAEPAEGEDPASFITIHLLEGDSRDFKVQRVNIRSIEYYEDLLLAESERLILARDFTKAFECLMHVKARDPKWKGLEEHVDRLLFAEGSAALLDGEGEKGLRLLRELSMRKPNYPGLADRLAASFGTRARKAFELGLYEGGRKILKEIEPLAPNHPELLAVRELYVKKAQGLLDASSKRQGAARLDALAEALLVWPLLKEADAPFREAFREWPTLDVAVVDVPRDVGPWVRSPADERVTRLLYRPVLARDDEEAEKGKTPGQLATEVNTADLGRRLVVTLRNDVAWSDASRNVAAVDLARTFTDAAEPSSAAFNARWADLVERVETPDETHIEIRLTRPLLKPSAWLLGPVGPAHAGSDGRVTVAGGAGLLVGDGPFLWSSGSRERFELVSRAGASPGGPTLVRRIREVRFPSARAALGAFTRGEVTLLEHVPPDQVQPLAANPEYKVGAYARPSMHRIAIDGRNPVLRNRNLRRGLSYAIDRGTLLEETVLRRPPDAANLVADGVFPKGSFADAPDVKPLEYDPLLARMLVAAARKEFGKPIELTFEYPAVPEAQAVVPKIVEAFTAAGLQIKAVERPESELESELRGGRRFDLAYRAGRLGDPVVDAGPMLTPAYDAPPSSDPLASLASPRILQLLLQLERAPEFPTARGLAAQVDRECRDELPVLPLWQLQDHYAWRTRLRGPAETAERLYDGIETWEVDAWFAQDTP